MNKVTPQNLVSTLNILEKLALEKGIYEIFSLNNYAKEEVMDAIHELNTLYPAYRFEYREPSNGCFHDLVVTNLERKQAYDRIPKPRTYGELEAEVEKEFGITSSSMFHQSNDRMTEKEYQDSLAFYRSLDDEFFQAASKGTTNQPN